MTRNLPLALLTLSVTACGTAAPPTPGLGEARFGETVRVGRLAVRPLALLEDSRCPVGVTCVSAGRVRIDALVGKMRRPMTLGEPIKVEGGTLLLAEVLPNRQAEVPIAAADYRFRFSFSR